MNNQERKGNRYWGFIDFEFQSAIGSRKADLISVGLVIYDTKDEQVIETFYSLIKPCNPVTKKVSKLTGLTNEVLSDAPKWITVSKGLEQLLKKYRHDISIFAYSDNDARTVEQVCQKYRIRNIFTGRNRIKDASVIIMKKMKLQGQALFEEMPSLSRLADFYHIEFEHKHNALEDAKVLGEVFEKTIRGVYREKTLVLPFLRNQVKPHIKDLEWDGLVFNHLSRKQDGSFELALWQGNFKWTFNAVRCGGRYQIQNRRSYEQLPLVKKQLLNHVLILVSHSEQELINLIA